MGYTPHVLIIGGGATGVATARDLAIRGLDVTLVEEDRLTAGATGRMQGLLYSGAVAASDSPRLARQTLSENRTLRTIAAPFLVDTGGLIVEHSEDSGERLDAIREACRECDIPADELDAETARELEPTLGPEVDRALQVPDAAIDPFSLTVATAKSALAYGAEICTRARVEEILCQDGAVRGAVVRANPPAGTDPGAVDLPGEDSESAEGESDDEAASSGQDTNTPGESGKQVPGQQTKGGRTLDSDALKRARERREGTSSGDENDEGETEDSTEGVDGESGGEATEREDIPERTIEADYVVNATGGWAGEITSLVEIELPMNHEKGGIAVANTEEVSSVVRRCTGGGPDTAVPMAGNCMIGTTDETAAGPNDETGEQLAADRLTDGLGAVLPAVADAQVLRTYWGVTSTIGDGDEPVELIDHGERDDMWGLVTVSTATLTTHRLAAERVADHVCSEFGIRRECQTDELPLPGTDGEPIDEVMAEFDVESPIAKRKRDGVETADGDGDEINPVLCECMAVRQREIREALDDDTGTDTDLGDVRIRTWAAMGECQGGLCAHQIASELYPEQDTEAVTDALTDLTEERWKGQRHSLRGEGLTQAMRNYVLHTVTMNRNRDTANLDLAEYDAGPEWDSPEQDRWGGGVPY